MHTSIQFVIAAAAAADYSSTLRKDSSNAEKSADGPVSLRHRCDSPSAASMQRTLAPSLLIVSMYSSSSTLSNTIPPPAKSSSVSLNRLTRPVEILRHTRLQVRGTILEGHRPDSDARVKLVRVEVESPNSSGVDPSLFLLQTADDLDCLDLGSARDRSSRED